VGGSTSSKAVHYRNKEKKLKTKRTKINTYCCLNEILALSAVSWPGLGFPDSVLKTLSPASSTPSFFAFFESFSSKAFV